MEPDIRGFHRVGRLPDEGHGLARLANQLDAYPRAADFLIEHLKP